MASWNSGLTYNRNGQTWNSGATYGTTGASANFGLKGVSVSNPLGLGYLTKSTSSGGLNNAFNLAQALQNANVGAANGGFGSDNFVSSPSSYDMSNYLPQPTPYTPPKQTTNPYKPPGTVGTPATSLDPNQYKLTGATAQDLANKYGFDYSRDYANAVAELERQLKETSLQSQAGQLEASKKNFASDLSHQYFQQFLQKQQDQVNKGINAGIAADQNLRLEMNRQNQAASFNREALAQQQGLFAQLANLPGEAQLRSEQLYQERLQQMMQNIAQENEFNASNLDRLLQIAQFNSQQQNDMYKFNNLSAAEKESNRLAWEQLQQQKNQFASEQAWREYTYNNLSAAERAQLEINIAQYGADMAWKMQEADMAMKNSALSALMGGASLNDVQNLYGSSNFLG